MAHSSSRVKLPAARSFRIRRRFAPRDGPFAPFGIRRGNESSAALRLFSFLPSLSFSLSLSLSLSLLSLTSRRYFLRSRALIVRDDGLALRNRSSMEERVCDSNFYRHRAKARRRILVIVLVIVMIMSVVVYPARSEIICFL